MRYSSLRSADRVLCAEDQRKVQGPVSAGSSIHECPLGMVAAGVLSTTTLLSWARCTQSTAGGTENRLRSWNDGQIPTICTVHPGFHFGMAAMASRMDGKSGYAGQAWQTAHARLSGEQTRQKHCRAMSRVTSSWSIAFSFSFSTSSSSWAVRDAHADEGPPEAGCVIARMSCCWIWETRRLFSACSLLCRPAACCCT